MVNEPDSNSPRITPSVLPYQTAERYVDRRRTIAVWLLGGAAIPIALAVVLAVFAHVSVLSMVITGVVIAMAFVFQYVALACYRSKVVGAHEPASRAWLPLLAAAVAPFSYSMLPVLILSWLPVNLPRSSEVFGLPTLITIYLMLSVVIIRPLLGGDISGAMGIAVLSVFTSSGATFCMCSVAGEVVRRL